MAKPHSTKLAVDYRGAKLEFGIHKGTGQYRKKYKGHTLYLGNDPEHVLNQWLAKTDEIENELAAKPVRRKRQPLTVSELCNRFLTDKEGAVVSGEITQVTFDNYFGYAKRLTGFFGRDTLIEDLGPADFVALKADLSRPQPQRREGKIVRKAIKRKLSLNGLASKIRHIKVFFNYAYGEGWIDRLPWGAKSFDLPKRKAIKKATAKKAPKQASREEVLSLLDAADDIWKAIILFAVNTGSGNTDTAELKHSDIGQDGWVETPRHKTGEHRRFKLWPETIEAISKLKRYKDDYVFHGQLGATLTSRRRNSPIGVGFAKVRKAAKVERGANKNLSFYSLRHTFQTVADEALDFIATKVVMGHPLGDGDISNKYRGRISDDRIEAVCEHVRQWLFGADVANDTGSE